jgi:putative SOS response-associated peptidase YedK
MPETTNPARSMLDDIAKNGKPLAVPTEEQLAVVANLLSSAGESVNILTMNLDEELRRIHDDRKLVLTAEQSWHLTYWADGIRLDAEMLIRWAAEVVKQVETLYMERPDDGH